MRNRLLLYFGLTLLLSLACTKVSIRKDYPELSGTYHWISSTDTTGTSYLNTNTNDKYDLRIKDNSRLLVYKNDEKIYKELVYVVEKIGDTSFIVTSGKGHKELICTITSGNLTTNGLPYTGMVNEFQK